jgi:hypothetical protein
LLAVIAAALAPSLSSHAQGTVQVSFASPGQGAVVDTLANVVVVVQSPNEITSAQASAGSTSSPLASTIHCSSRYSCYPAWAGTLDLTGLARGPVTISVTATDALGNSGSATRTVTYDRLPTLVVTSPKPHQIARPQIAIVATCLDDDPVGCVAIDAAIEQSIGSGVAEINAVVDLSGYQGTSRNIIIRGRDSTGRLVGVEIPVHVEGSGALQEDAVVPGKIVDVDADRILFNDPSTGQLAIRDRGAGGDTIVHSDAGNPFYAPYGYLTAAGAAFVLSSQTFPHTIGKSFESGVLQDLGPLGASSLRGNGRYLIWNDDYGSNLFRRDVLTGSTLTVASAVGNWNNDVAPDGAVAFWNASYDVGLYKPDGSTTMLTADPDDVAWNVYPRTDGHGVLYLKRPPCCGGGPDRLFLARGGSQEELTTGYEPEHAIKNGWVAFNKPGPSGVDQVWRMDSLGAKTQLTFASNYSELEALAGDGSVALLQIAQSAPFQPTQRRRMVVSGTSTSLVEIGSELGTFRFAGNAPHVFLEGTLFSANAPVLRASPAALPFAAQPVATSSAARVVTFTNTGTAPVTVSSVTASGDFAVASNGCATVAPGAGCQVGVTFTPTATGTRTGTLSISGAGAEQVRSLSGIGVLRDSFSNLSTRMQVLTGDDVMIGGFVIGGTATKTVAIVATGPSLSAYGIANPLANPRLTLVRMPEQTVVATNNDWQSAPNAAQLQATGFAPPDPLEAAILVTLPSGAYTAIVDGVGDGTGVAVFAVYEVDTETIPLVNISTRGQVRTGNDVMISGFVIGGSRPQTVAIVATGPSLAAYGIANPLANPSLVVVRSSDQSIVAINDNWQEHANAAQLQASGFAPPHALESAVYLTLQPGAYTAILSGADGGVGAGIVGVYTVN